MTSIETLYSDCGSVDDARRRAMVWMLAAAGAPLFVTAPKGNMSYATQHVELRMSLGKWMGDEWTRVYVDIHRAVYGR